MMMAAVVVVVAQNEVMPLSGIEPVVRHMYAACPLSGSASVGVVCTKQVCIRLASYKLATPQCCSNHTQLDMDSTPCLQELVTGNSKWTSIGSTEWSRCLAENNDDKCQIVDAIRDLDNHFMSQLEKSETVYKNVFTGLSNVMFDQSNNLTSLTEQIGNLTSQNEALRQQLIEMEKTSRDREITFKKFEQMTKEALNNTTGAKISRALDTISEGLAEKLERWFIMAIIVVGAFVTLVVIITTLFVLKFLYRFVKWFRPNSTTTTTTTAPAPDPVTTTTSALSGWVPPKTDPSCHMQLRRKRAPPT
jgi:hypothetical protein